MTQSHCLKGAKHPVRTQQTTSRSHLIRERWVFKAAFSRCCPRHCCGMHADKNSCNHIPPVCLVGGEMWEDFSLLGSQRCNVCCLLPTVMCPIKAKRGLLCIEEVLGVLEHMLTPVAFQRLCKFQLTLLSHFPFRDTARGIWQTMK